MNVLDEIKKQLLVTLKEMGIEGIDPTVDCPTNPKNGDYSSNVAMVAAKKLGKNPKELAQEIVSNIKYPMPPLRQGFEGQANIQPLERVEVAGSGFINFWVGDEWLIKGVGKVGQIWEIDKGKKVVVEYSSPNIAKPFTIGHLRSTIIGDAVANLLEATGWTVYRDNHLGDWGTQFGKQIYSIKQWGNEEEIEKSDRPVKILVDLYIKFHEEAKKHPEIEDEARGWFKRLESGDVEARVLWQKCIDWSWKEFEGIYKTLGVHFTENEGRGYGESFFEDQMKPIVKELEEQRLLKEGEEGAKLIFFPNNEPPPLMILKKDGSSLYATRDLAADRFRLRLYGKAMVINEVGIEQSLYFQQLFKLEEMLGWYQKGDRIHIKHGHYRFKEGKMSTRKGNVIWLEDVLVEAEKRAGELGGLEGKDGLELAKVVGIGAIKWNDLKRDSKQDIVFDWDDILNMQGNSGPYMQYTFARTQSVLAKVKSQSIRQAQDAKTKVKSDLELNSEERELLLRLSQFSEAIEEAASRFAPNILCTYLFELAQTFNLFYQKHQILKAEDDDRDLRLAITNATGRVIKKGLALLGIETPERM